MNDEEQKMFAEEQKMFADLFNATAAYVRWSAPPSSRQGDLAYLFYIHCLEILKFNKTNPADIATLVEKHVNG